MLKGSLDYHYCGKVTESCSPAASYGLNFILTPDNRANSNSGWNWFSKVYSCKRLTITCPCSFVSLHLDCLLRDAHYPPGLRRQANSSYFTWKLLSRAGNKLVLITHGWRLKDGDSILLQFILSRSPVHLVYSHNFELRFFFGWGLHLESMWLVL